MLKSRAVRASWRAANPRRTAVSAIIDVVWMSLFFVPTDFEGVYQCVEAVRVHRDRNSSRLRPAYPGTPVRASIPWRTLCMETARRRRPRRRRRFWSGGAGYEGGSGVLAVDVQLGTIRLQMKLAIGPWYSCGGLIMSMPASSRR